MKQVFFPLRSNFASAPTVTASSDGRGRIALPARRAILLSMALCASIARADGIVSAPAGFVRVVAQPGEQTPASLPFVPFDPTLENIVKGQFDAGDEISIWNPAAQTWRVFSKAGTGRRWNDAAGVRANVELDAGDALWIRNRQAERKAILLAGTVVLDDWRSSALYPGLNMLAYPYSTGIRTRDTTLRPLLATNVPAPNALLKPDTANTPAWLGAGRAYWFAQNSSASNALMWSEPRPYGGFFDVTGGPVIANVSPSQPGRAIEVAIVVPPGVAALDIFWQDIPPDSDRVVFDPFSNWRMATANIAVAQGAATLLSPVSLQWTDRGDATRAAPDQTRGRYYLVARADVDADRDGLPDARARLTPDTALALASVSDPINLTDGTSPILGTTTNVPPEGGITNVGVVVGSAPVRASGRTVYVDAKNGRDSNTGRRAMRTAVDGPKATINAGLREAKDDDTIIVRAGRYGEKLHLRNRNNHVRIEGSVNLTRASAPPARSASAPVPVSTTTNGINQTLQTGATP